MAEHNLTGRTGENIAALYLQQEGYTILHKNWRYSYYEIDIIATKKYKLHFIEVKTRKAGGTGYPEDGVTRKKFKFLQQAAHEYLQQNSDYKWIQYDILSLTIHPDDTVEYFMLEDVYL